MTKATTKTKMIEEDPPERVPRYDWAETAEGLRAKPGKWHKIFEQDSTGFANSIRAGEITALRPEDGFEVKTANNTRGRPKGHPEGYEPRRCDLFLRWVKPKRKTKAAT